MKKKTLGKILLVAGVLFIFFGCVNPPPTQAPGGSTPTPTPVFSVACKYSTAMAGQPDASGNLPLLSNCTGSENESLLNFNDFLEGDFVSAGEPGEAVIDIDNCARIYVFKSSTIRKSTCAEKNLGSTTCSISGTSVYNNSCSSHLKYVFTPSARFEFVGTYATITYNAELERSTVIVLDGAVFAQPVLDTGTFELGEPVEVQPEQFWYTEPGEVLPEDLRPGQALPLEVMPNTDVIQDVENWIDDISDRFQLDAIPVPEFFPTLTDGVLIRGRGGILSDPTVGQAILFGVDWQAASQIVGIPPETPLFLYFGDESLDARSVNFDIERSQALLEEAGVFGDSILFFVVSEVDGRALEMARFAADQLSEVNLPVEFVIVNQDELAIAEREFLNAGEAVIVFRHPGEGPSGLSLTLVIMEGGEPIPNLAEAWEVSEDGIFWTFFLEPDREMSDGTPYTADLVAQVLEERGPGQIKGYAGAEVIDDYTMIVYLESPNQNFLNEVARIELPQ